MLEWVVMPSSQDLPDPAIEPMPLTSPALAGSLPRGPPGKPPVIHTYYVCFFFIFFSMMVYDRIMSMVPCAIQ